MIVISIIDIMHSDQLDLPLLLALDALVSERSVTRAAARLGRGQPALSHALMRLRRVLGDPVLARTSAGMTPTPRALDLLARIRHPLAELRRAVADPARFDPGTTERTFTIVMRDYTEVVLLPALLDELRRVAPGLRLRVVPLGETLPVGELEASRIDLAIGYFGRVPGGLRSQILLRERFVCLTGRDHPVADGPLTLARYCRLRHVLVSPSGGGRGPVDTLLDRRRRARTIVLVIPDFVAAGLIVARTDLVATVPALIAGALQGMVPVRSLRPPFHLAGFPVTQVWSPHVDADDGHRWLRRTISRLMRAADQATIGPA
jgi:DNA-binding transcriptional LysR family regulator